MIIDSLGDYSVTAVSVMREGDAYGSEPEQLRDGNTLPSLCIAAGEGACAISCQIDTIDVYEPKLCAEENIDAIANEASVLLDRLVIVPASEDAVIFGDEINSDSEIPESGIYQKTSPANAFFYRPGVDRTMNDEPIDAVAMRMADCGSVAFEFVDADGAVILGQSHFSRTNMHPESEFNEEHSIGGKPSSWAEYVLGTAIEHYDANPKSIKIKLTAATKGTSFSFPTVEKFKKHWPGWIEHGFAEVIVTDDGSETVKVNYRKMISWQINRAANRFGVESKNIELEDAIDTESVESGHASHQNARIGKIAHGRDLYLVGINRPALVQQRLRRIDDAHFSDMIGDSESVDINEEEVTKIRNILQD